MAQKQFKQFNQLSQEERIEIYRYKEQGFSNRKIGKLIKRNHTTIGRELDRNSIDYGRGNLIYKPLEAEKKKTKRKETANKGHIKLRKNHALREKIHSLLIRYGYYWGLDEIIGLLKREGRKSVSTSTAYKYIRTYTDRWRYLRFKQEGYTNRRWKRKTTITIKGVPKIDERPMEANNRTEIGHREGDTIVSSGSLGGLFSNIDRFSRYYLLKKIPNHEANTLLTVMTSKLRNEKIISLTTDNGVEFAKLALLGKRLKIKVFTAHAYASYERPSNERHNGLVRRFIPKGTNIDEYTDEEIQKIEDMLNHKPRKILGYRTPYEVYHNTKLSYI